MDEENRIRRFQKYDRDRRMRRRRFEENRRRRNSLLLVFVLTLACTVDRGVWCKYRSGHFWQRVVNEEFTAQDFRDNFRVNKSTFEFLCSELEPVIGKPSTNFRETVSVRKRVAITLWRLSTNCDYRTIGHLFGVSRSTVCIIVNATCRAIVDGLLQRYISFPKGERLHATIEGFQQKGFPQVGGVIDGTHIPIIGPEDYPADYYNRKGWYSVILQAVCDNNFRFTDILVGWPGRCHDARVFANSSLYQRGQRGQLFPDITRNINGVNIPLLILGDPAYPLLPWLMKGFSDNGRLTDAQQNFNFRLSSARMVIEGAFGRLKGRFRCLLKRCDSNLANINVMVTACCVLHNICEMQSDEPDAEWKDVVDELQCFQPPIPHGYRNRQNGPATPAATIRNALTDFLNQ